jgi:hypothetical protein
MREGFLASWPTSLQAMSYQLGYLPDARLSSAAFKAKGETIVLFVRL